MAVVSTRWQHEPDKHNPNELSILKLNMRSPMDRLIRMENDSVIIFKHMDIKINTDTPLSI